MRNLALNTFRASLLALSAMLAGPAAQAASRMIELFMNDVSRK